MNELQARRMVHAYALYRAAMRRTWRLVPTLTFHVLNSGNISMLGGWWRLDETENDPVNDNEHCQ